jgi:hypothetical protein
MIKTESRQIGNSIYEVRMLGASKGREVITYLIKNAGPVVGALVEEANLSRKTIDTKDLSRALQELGGRLGKDDLTMLCRTFGECTQVGTDQGGMIPLTLDKQELHFAGEYMEMMKWLGFCLELNFSDFLGELRRMIDAASAPEEETGTSQ